MLTPRADHLVRRALEEHITDYPAGGGGFFAFLKNRRAAWISPRGKTFPLNTPNEHHHDWARDHTETHKVQIEYGSGRATKALTDKGWVRKMDHDQYVIGPEQHKEKVFRHLAKHHPRLDRVWISHEESDGTNTPRWYFKRDDGGWRTDSPGLTKTPGLVRSSQGDSTS